MRKIIEVNLVMFLAFGVICQIIAMMGVPMSSFETSMWSSIGRFVGIILHIAFFTGAYILLPYFAYKGCRKVIASVIG